MLEKIKEEILKANKIVLVGHVRPDGDCIGACVAFKYMIEKMDATKQVKVCINDELPKYLEKLDYLPKIYDKVNDEIDLLISLDVANIERVAIDTESISKAKKTIAIDHHISNKKYFDINYVVDISSASELIYRFLDVFNITLDKKIATYMYLGIINDTGNFKHNNVTDKTFLVASKLAESGINMNKIYQVLFSKTRKKASLFSKSIVNGVYDESLKFMYFFLPKDSEYTKDDTDGVSEYMLTIDDVDVSLFLQEESDNTIKGSFRSKGPDVNMIASKFNGGGHILASGFKTDKKLEEIIEVTKRLLKWKK